MSSELFLLPPPQLMSGFIDGGGTQRVYGVYPISGRGKERLPCLIALLFLIFHFHKMCA